VSPPIPAPITTACLPIRVDAIAASLLRAPPATEVPTPVEHIATRRRKEAAKSSRASASWTLQSVCWRKRYADFRFWQIVLQNSSIAVQLISHQKTKRAPIAGRCSLRLVTDLGYEFVARSSSPPHNCLMAAPTARKICAQ
jgi:hypothetical protein